MAIRKVRKQDVKKILLDKAGAKDKGKSPKKRKAKITKKRIAKK